MFIELLQDGPSDRLDSSSSVASLFPREGAERRSDDARVTVWDHTWPAGSSTGLIRYPRDTLTVWLGSGVLRLTSAEGAVSTLNLEPGEVRFSEAGRLERMELLAGAPRAMVFELK